MATHAQRRGSRRFTAGATVVAAVVLAVASVAAACTGIAPSGGHYLEVTPDAGVDGTTVVVAGYLFNSGITSSGPCTDPCPAAGTGGKLWQSGPLASTGISSIVTEPVTGVHTVNDCNTEIGTVTYEVNQDDALVVHGIGTIDAGGLTGPQLFRVCADPDPTQLWNYFAMV